MVEIHVYGKLRRHAPCSRASGESVLRMQTRPGDTVATILARAGIALEDVYHVFLNGAILSTRNSMAPWLQYEQAERSSIERQAVGGSSTGNELDAHVQDGDRIGLFADDMGLLVV